jgi:hypothetical protein
MFKSLTGDIRISWHINKTSCKNQKLLLGLGVRRIKNE